MEPLGSIPVGVVHSFELLTNDEFFGVYRKSYQDGSGRITYVIAHLPPIIAYTEPPASVLVEFINKSEAICTFNRWKEDPLLAQPIGRVRDRLPPFARLFQPSILIEKPVTGCTPHLDVMICSPTIRKRKFAVRLAQIVRKTSAASFASTNSPCMAANFILAISALTLAIRARAASNAFQPFPRASAKR